MKKVFVSGGSGYIALHCIAALIKKGFLVRTSIRSLERKKKLSIACLTLLIAMGKLNSAN